MADNRLWLVNRRTGIAIMLGKSLGWGWYDPPTKERFMAFFDCLEKHAPDSIDDFVLAIENAKRTPSATDNWEYGWEDGDMVDGFRKIHLLEETDEKMVKK